MKYKLEIKEENTMRFYRTLFVNNFTVIPDDFELHKIMQEKKELPFVDFEYDFKGLSDKSEILNAAITECHDKLGEFIKDITGRDIRIQLEAHSIEIKDLLIKTLYEESKLQDDISFTLVDGHGKNRNLTDLERLDFKMVASRIRQKPHLEKLMAKCQDVVVRYFNYPQKIKKKKRKMGKPK